METPSYIQLIDSSRSLVVIDAHWSTEVIAISLILHPIPQNVIGLEPEAAEHKQCPVATGQTGSFQSFHTPYWLHSKVLFKSSLRASETEV